MKISDICSGWDNSILIDSSVLKKITGYEEVINKLGQWPSFESAEVVEISLSRGDMLEKMRNSVWEGVWPEAYITLTQFESSNDPESSSTMKIKFHVVHEVLVNQFNYQNSVCGIGIEEIYSDRLKKSVVSFSWGGGAIPHEGYIECDRLSVEML